MLQLAFSAWFHAEIAHNNVLIYGARKTVFFASEEDIENYEILIGAMEADGSKTTNYENALKCMNSKSKTDHERGCLHPSVRFPTKGEVDANVSSTLFGSEMSQSFARSRNIEI